MTSGSNYITTFGGSTTSTCDIVSTISTPIGTPAVVYMNIGNLILQFSYGVHPGNSYFYFETNQWTPYGVQLTATSNEEASAKDLYANSFYLSCSAYCYGFAWGISNTPTTIGYSNMLTTFGSSQNSIDIMSSVKKTFSPTGYPYQWSCMYMGNMLFQFTNTTDGIGDGYWQFPEEFYDAYGCVVTSTTNTNAWVSSLSIDGLTVGNGGNSYCFAWGLRSPSMSGTSSQFTTTFGGTTKAYDIMSNVILSNTSGYMCVGKMCFQFSRGSVPMTPGTNPPSTYVTFMLSNWTVCGMGATSTTNENTSIHYVSNGGFQIQCDGSVFWFAWGILP